MGYDLMTVNRYPVTPYGDDQGMYPALYDLVQLLKAPRATFVRFRDRPVRHAITWYGTFLALATTLSLILWYARVGASSGPWGENIYGNTHALTWQVIVPFLVATAGMLLFCLVVHALVYLCGGRGGFRKTLAAVLYAATPVLLISWIPLTLPAPVVTLTIFAAAFTWSVILAIAGLSLLHELSLWRAVLPVIVVLITLVLVLFILFAQQSHCSSCERYRAITAGCSGGDIRVTYLGGMYGEELQRVTVSINGVQRSSLVNESGRLLLPGTEVIYPGPFAGTSRVLVVGIYPGRQQVLADYALTCSEG